jgi:hypothetical protein
VAHRSEQYDPRMSRHPAIRNTTAVLATSAVAIAVALTAPASPALSVAPAAATAHFTLPSRAYRAHDYAHGQAMSILPPGENGSATIGQLVTYGVTGQRPPHSQDQLGKYEKLLYGYKTLTDKKLGKYYDDESFGVPKSRPAPPSRPARPSSSATRTTCRTSMAPPMKRGRSAPATPRPRTGCS